jgi:ribosomal protein L13
MNTLSYKTISANKATVQKEWVVVDATDQVLGRLATKVAKLLRGKYKPSFTPNVDCGDNVIIINADKIVLTGQKMTDRVYLRFSGYPGGQKKSTPPTFLPSPTAQTVCSTRSSRVCCPRTASPTASSPISTSMPVPTTSTRHRSPRQLILTS